MTYNDPGWSVFWASGSSRSAPPTGSVLKVGKHVGEDSVTTRANEEIGYLVLETSTSGTARIEGLPYIAAVGGDSIKGVGDAPAYSYSYQAMANSKTAVVSQAGMDGGNGGWAVLYGSDPITPQGDTLNIAIDEDQNKDSERRHTSEQVAYLIIDPPLQPFPAAANSLDFVPLGLPPAPHSPFSEAPARTAVGRSEQRLEWSSLLEPLQSDQGHHVLMPDRSIAPSCLAESIARRFRVLDEFFASHDLEDQVVDEDLLNELL